VDSTCSGRQWAGFVMLKEQWTHAHPFSSCTCQVSPAQAHQWPPELGLDPASAPAHNNALATCCTSGAPCGSSACSSSWAPLPWASLPHACPTTPPP
jgi:hypothetical protein